MDNPRDLAGRIDLLYWAGRLATKAALNSFYHVEYRNTDRLKAMGNEPFILLPKHQHNFDVVVEGNLVADVLDRSAYYAMKDTLPDWLRWFGGIKVNRPPKRITRAMALGDPELAKARIEQRKANKKSRARTEGARTGDVYRCLAHLYTEGEAIVTHIEAKRNYRKEGLISDEVVDYLINLETDRELVFVPLDIEYENVRKFRSTILASVGEPIWTRDAEKLKRHMIQEVRLLR